jgi:hypothetical protein
MTTKKKFVYSNNDYNSGDGMLTNVWGPSIWHFLHTMSFNYPVDPTADDKEHYKSFITNLQYTLPCKYCRINLSKNLKTFPITSEVLKNRENFSKYVYDLHNLINKMLKKKIKITYEEVRDRYEHFRSRCTITPKVKRLIKTIKKESGCTEPMYGKKSKCIIKIVPQETRGKSFQMDKQCFKKKSKTKKYKYNI